MPENIRPLFPEIEPFQSGLLEVSNTHHIYYEQCGNPSGQPIVFLHGGPGSGCNPTQRRFFDPNHYRIILMDQRGCGRSKPLGETRENTTSDLVTDIESLRKKLGIRRWLVFGGSWGSTLALAYALAHPDRVDGLILRGIFMSRPVELRWFLGEVKLFFPEAWERLIEFLPESEQGNVVEGYSKRIFSDDAHYSVPAAIRWNEYESSIMSLLPRKSEEKTVPDEIHLARARVQIYYIREHCFVGHRDLLQEAREKLANIPTTIIQGRYDMVCPPLTAWELNQAMPHAEFVMVDNAGHSAMEPGITSALVVATEKFKQIGTQI